ncbi:uncharacterized protein [Halyomorpha halys]|uniref:uncharacterized protein n=1 Tax=Halyomorpha halys TaxID=286706 RepID=UPI0034D2ECB2
MAESIKLKPPDNGIGHRKQNVSPWTRKYVELNFEEDDKKFTDFSPFKNLKKIVRLTLHRSLNYSKGLLFCPEISTYSGEEVQNELLDKGVTEVKRIFKKLENTKIPTHLWVLTFASPDLPGNIKLDFINIKVRLYIPNPVQCFKCYAFNHFFVDCQKHICGKCGLPFHEGECMNEMKCINCTGKLAWSRSCKSFLKEKEIQIR